MYSHSFPAPPKWVDLYQLFSVVRIKARSPDLTALSGEPQSCLSSPSRLTHCHRQIHVQGVLLLAADQAQLDLFYFSKTQSTQWESEESGAASRS